MDDILHRLERTIAERMENGHPENSYVAKQLAKGRLKLAEKLGEEAVETVIAAVAEDDRAFVGEAADLLFHLLILLRARGLSLDDVRSELARREGLSGIEEKARRL